jgi:membrane-associated protease RseP (regulator of RpoE activity)
VFFSPAVHVIGTAVRNITPLAYLGLPGINPYIPIVDGWASLIFAMVVHEGAHGVVARSLGFPVKSSGLLFFLILPIGAFVEVDEGALKAAKARDSGRILAAGAGVNFVAGALFLLLLFNVVSGMAPTADGLGITRVASPSPAAASGLQYGDIIVAVNGVHYDDGNQFLNSTWYKAGHVVNVTLSRQGESKVVSLTVGARPSVLVNCTNSSTTSGAETCTATVHGFFGSIEKEVIYFSASGSGAFNDTTCRVAGDSCGVTYTPSPASGLQNVTAIYFGNSENAPASGTTGSASSSNTTTSLGYLGINSDSYSYLKGLVSGYTGAFFTRPITYFCIPTFPNCSNIVPFSDTLSVFYTSPYGTWLVPVTNLLYWFFFLNFNLAIFNALPIYPLDGGQAFRTGLKGLAGQRLSEQNLTRVTSVATLLVVVSVASLPLAAYLGLI